jgi:uncharacterized RDD family membrane protein YckC
VDDREGIGSGRPGSRPVGRELNPREADGAGAGHGPGRFATPQYTGDYGATPAGSPQTGALPLDQPYDRSAYGHYEPGERYTPQTQPQVLPLPDGITYASWGSRCGAWFIDLFLQFLCVVPAFAAGELIRGTLDPGEVAGAGPRVLYGVLYGLGWLVGFYQWAWRQGARGQSWGKQLMGIHLVSANDFQPPGGAIGLARHLLRGVFWGLTFGIYLFVTAFWPLSDIRMQTLDDKLVNTLVVRLPPERAVF